MICKLRLPGIKYLNGKARKTLKTPYFFFVFNPYTNKCRKRVYLFSRANSFHNAYIERECLFQNTQGDTVKKEGSNSRIT